MNEVSARWVGACDWEYRTTFQVDPELLHEERIDLVFEGLDTVAKVALNGQMVGTAENMHVRHRFDVRAVLVPGENHLSVHFGSAIDHARSVEREVGARPGVGSGTNPQLPHQMIRKMACNFGWDWGPQLVTCGIWRPARIEFWSAARLHDVRPLVTQADTQTATVEVHADGEIAAEASGVSLRCVLASPDGRVVAERDDDWSGRPGGDPIVLTVDEPRRWWPIGYGDRPLYELRVELVAADGRVLDVCEQKVGLRQVRLITEPDTRDGGGSMVQGLTRGESFHLEVNGQRVFCKGANWIPDDCFPHRVTPQRYRQRIEQAVDANMNMLRVWGGGIYEDHAFYEICDELGVMVWQDFGFACACYAEEEPLRSEVEAEARDNVARLSRHPSLVIWNGCNENFWAAFDWPAFEGVYPNGELTWGLGYYLDLLPRVVAELDTSRPYWPGSPFSGNLDRHPNGNEYGNCHIWDVWNHDGDYRNYLGHFPRFASEFGYMAPPNWATLDRAIPKDQQHWSSEAMTLHNKQKDGIQRGLERLADSHDPPDRYEDQWFIAAIEQARAIALGCEWFRSLSPWCSGALYWQLNDCWPVTSWSAIDGDGRPKLMWHATQRFFRSRLLTLMPARVTPSGVEVERLAAYLHNDHAERWRGRMQVSRMNVAGQLLDTKTFAVDVAPRGVQKWELSESWIGEADEFLMAHIDGEPTDNRAWWFFGRDRDVEYPTPTLNYTLEETDAGQRLTVASDVLVRELCLLADRIEPSARIDRQLVTLLPGESTVFHVTGDRRLTLEQLTAPDVLRCVNGLQAMVPTPT
ncbi:MAG: sugar-binding domain-containing protein [Planctomycetota bacterium]